MSELGYWCNEHPIMTFLIILAAVGAIGDAFGRRHRL